MAATSSITAQIEINIHVFTNSPLPLRCIMRRVNQTLSPNAVEYAKNSSHTNGRKKSIMKKLKRGGRPCVMLSAAITTPVLYNTYKPKIGPAMGTNIAKHNMKLFPKIN